ncbi:DOPA-like domain-containing protein [Microdochium trichocladiopsis]|uniref:DOPA-like domain-containing protein n=1 Tax=Microdochium trichocladiopsis TaxID=1682393 RepID=A0A9P8XVG9_9PEZI|nr:DOPA-like domain-containing protein [Microdochium trichocladiopsis]KAH7020913.1 DOPA-like domain-containing protein [Microdochium trichocladiopsis]
MSASVPASAIAKTPVPTRPVSTYPPPLSGKYANLPPLPEDKAPDGKSYVNPPAADGKPSEAYGRFTAPLDNGIRGGFDVHIYHDPSDAEQAAYALQLWERIRREFPELRIYRFWQVPIGPHPLAMFEVNLHTPAHFGAFVPWLAIWRGPLSALVHPNTLPHSAPGGEAEAEAEDEGRRELRNHTERAMWMGERLELSTAIFDKMSEAAAAARQKKDGQE